MKIMDLLDNHSPVELSNDLIRRIISNKEHSNEIENAKEFLTSEGCQISPIQNPLTKWEVGTLVIYNPRNGRKLTYDDIISSDPNRPVTKSTNLISYLLSDTVKESTNMKVLNSADEVRKFISKNLKDIHDQAFAAVLRDIIFKNNIDWHKAAASINHHMAETTVEG